MTTSAPMSSPDVRVPDRGVHPLKVYDDPQPLPRDSQAAPDTGRRVGVAGHPLPSRLVPVTTKDPSR